MTISDDLLQVQCLGGLFVFQGEAPLTDFISRKAPALLCYLAVTGRPYSRQALAGLLWGESPESKALASLRTVLSNLRQHLAPYLDITRQTVGLDPESTWTLDANRFVELLNFGLQNENDPSEEQAAALEAALELYRGDFLEGFYLDDAPAFEEWVWGQRERLRQLALRGLYVLGEVYLNREDYAASIDTATRLLAIEPWQEAVHQQLMRALALSGQRNAALAQYETCRRVLQEELGVAPTPETTALYEQLQQLRVGTPLATREPLVMPVAPPHNLPRLLTPFFGRERERAQLHRLVREPSSRWITLVGPGGVGKTRLALAAAEALLREFQDGIWFVPLLEDDAAPTPRLERLRARQLLLESIAAALRLPAALSLLDYLADRQLLLILDNFEPFTAAGDLIVELLQRAPQVKVWVTSRQRLKYQAEHVYQVGGLEVPEAADVADAASYSCVQLFAERAARLAADFWLDAETLPEVVRLCQQVEGNPLAIELATVWVGQFELSQILDALQQDIDQLATTMWDLPGRQRSMRAVFEHSWHLLPASEQALLTRLTLFQGGFSEAAAQAVAEATPAQLAGLCERFLLRCGPEGHYKMQRLLRQYVVEKVRAASLDGALALDDWRARHADYYLRLVGERAAAICSGMAAPVLQALLQDLGNIERAWDWAAEQGAHPLLALALPGIVNLWEVRGAFEEAAQRFAIAAWRVRSQCEDPPSAEALALWGALVAAQAHFLNLQEQHAEALALAEQVIARVSDAQVRARAYLQGGRALWYREERAVARDYLEEALALAAPTETLCVLAKGSLLLGRMAAQAGNYGEATLRAEAAWQHYQLLGERRGQAAALELFGEIAAGQGQYSEAVERYWQGLRYFRDMAEAGAVQRVLNALTALLLGLGRFVDAQAVLKELAQDFEAQHNVSGAALVMGWQGCLALRLGNWPEAGRQLQSALTLARTLGDRRWEGRVLGWLSQLALRRGQRGPAVVRATEALAILQALTDGPLVGWGHCCLGMAHLAQREWSAAQRACAEAASRAIMPGARAEALVCLLQVAAAEAAPDRAQLVATLGAQFAADPALVGACHPGWCYWVYYEALLASGDARAEAVLAQGRALLQERAGQFAGEVRQRYLERPPGHRELVGAQG